MHRTDEGAREARATALTLSARSAMSRGSEVSVECTASTHSAVAEPLCCSPRPLLSARGVHPHTVLAVILTLPVARVELSRQASDW